MSISFGAVQVSVLRASVHCFPFHADGTEKDTMVVINELSPTTFLTRAYCTFA